MIIMRRCVGYLQIRDGGHQVGEECKCITTSLEGWVGLSENISQDISEEIFHYSRFWISEIHIFLDFRRYLGNEMSYERSATSLIIFLYSNHCFLKFPAKSPELAPPSPLCHFCAK